MAGRDVDLVIKARDQAASVIKSITDALNEFVDAQKDIDNRAEKTETTLGALGVAVGKLDKELKGLTAGSVLTDELTRAGNALARIEARFQGTQSEAAQLEQQLRRSTTATDRYASKLDGAAAAQERQRAALKNARADQAALTQSYERAVSAQDKLAARQQKLPGLIERASVAADKAARRYDDLSAEIAGTANPTRTLQQRFEASSRTLQTTSERLSKLRAEYSEIGGSLRAAGSAVVLFGQASEQANQNVARQETILRKIGDNYERLKVQTGAAAQNQKKIQTEFNKTTGVLNRQGAEVDKARADYAQLAASTDQAAVAIQRLANSGLAELYRQWQQQRRSVLEAKRAYVEAREEATTLGRALAKATSPSADLVASFERAKATSASLKGELLEQRVAYEELGRVYRGTGDDIDSVIAAQNLFANTQERLQASARETAAALDREVQSINRLRGVTGQAITNTRLLATEQERGALAATRAAAANNRLAAAYRQFYGDSRRSLSLLQRIRGEVLSLAAAYGGLFAGIEALRLTVDATQQLEAAQSRLSVAFDGDQARVAQELDFLRRTAERLGVNFGTLATEYSKFQIATNNTAISAEAARKIFVQVTEAARVNRSSTKELSGVFVALTQIVSKGAVQMEELRQQLGDRLPGALQIMADGLDVTTAELIKMLEQGEVTEEALIGFGDELERRFGGGLDDALGSLTVALGRLSNAAFQAAIRFGQAGFIEGFQELVQSLVKTLNSADFEAFAARISSAFGGLLEFFGFAVENFQVLVTALTAFLAFRLSPVVVALTGSFVDLGRTTTRTAANFQALQARANAMGVSVTRAGLAVRNLARFMRGLLASTGVGLAFVAISTAIAAWSTEADKATEALNTHRQLVDEVRNAYDLAAGSIEAWRENLEDVTARRAKQNLREIQDALEDVSRDLAEVILNDGTTATQRFVPFLDLFTGASQDYNRAVEDVIRRWRDGALEAKDFQKEIDDLGEKFGDNSAANRRFAESLDETVAKIVELSEKVDEAKAVVDAKTGSDEDAAEAARELGLASEQAAEALDPQKTRAYNSALQQMADIVDDVTKKNQLLEQSAQIEGAFEQAISNAQTLEERVQANIDKVEALKGITQNFVDTNFGGFTDGVEASAALIRRFEGFRSTPYFDVNALRAGFGSDTITLADGTIQKVTAGIAVSINDANRDLYRRIRTEFRPIAAAAAGDRFEVFTPQQQAALTSLAYNYGEIPDRVARVLRTGTAEQIAAAIRSLAGDNAGVNRGRRFQEAALFTSQPALQTQVSESERLLELEKQRNEETKARIENNQFELSQNQLKLQGAERQAAIEAAIRDARAQNPNISDAEIAKIREQTAALFDQEQAIKNIRTEKERAQDAEAEVNRLLGIQNQLREQLSLALQQGDAGRAQEIRDEINALNNDIVTAIDNAIRMWEAIGGTEADSAIAKLTTARIQAERLGTQAEQNYLQWNRVADLFVNRLAGAFDNFAQAVANGQNVGEAARNAFLQFAADFLREIARMIIQQAIFNALRGAFGGTNFGALIGVGHTGGLVGSSRVGSGNSTRRVNPAMFAAAARFHGGGLIGLRPGEVPIIARRGEEMLTEDDPRHILNGGGGAGTGGVPGLTVINAVDGSDAMNNALAETEGQEVFFNFIRSNRTTVLNLLGIAA